LRNGKAASASRTEAFAFRLILALALGGVILGLAGLPPLASGLQSLVAFVCQWVG
jgi:hypothetical protein